MKHDLQDDARCAFAGLAWCDDDERSMGAQGWVVGEGRRLDRIREELCRNSIDQRVEHIRSASVFVESEGLDHGRWGSR